MKHSKELEDGKEENHDKPESHFPSIELVLLGAEDDLKKRLRQVVESEGWKEILRDPYVLLNLILDELYLNMDRNVQDISGLFGGIENVSEKGLRINSH